MIPRQIPSISLLNFYSFVITLPFMKSEFSNEIIDYYELKNKNQIEVFPPSDFYKFY